MLEKKNYEVNKNIDLGTEPINGQGCGKVSLMRYGAFPMSYNGCEMIAIYNFCILEKLPHGTLADICLEMYPKSGILWGVFGSDCFRMKSYFKKRKIEYKRFLKRNSFFDELNKTTYGIITVWNSINIFKGIHTVCVEKLTNGNIRVYNRSNKKTQPCEFKTVDEITQKCCFICGYTLKK